MDGSRPILVIPDTQIPFENEKALSFCADLKRHYKIPDCNILHVGDEVDSYHGGSWPKDPNGHFTASGEIASSREKIKKWASVFPEMKLAISNHGLRWVRKATGAEIPSEVIRSYQEIFQTPPGWKWKEEWRFTDLKHPFRMIHGMSVSGINGHRNASIDSGMSTIIGHLHASAAVSYIYTIGGLKIWACNAGCLIDVDAYAFEYGKYSRLKPVCGAVVIFDSGRMPVFHPL
jgi:hypothetical protein